MILVESVVGNERDAAWNATLEGAAVDPLRLDQWQAQKNRFRRKTESGVEVAVALGRNTHLHDGDILHWDESGRSAIVARIQLQDVLVIRLEGVLDQPGAILARTCVELGHALGNQHWPAVVKESAVYVPLTVDRKVMASVMKTHAFAGITYEFQPGAEVIPFLAPHEARRLFGGADSTPHSHLPVQSLVDNNTIFYKNNDVNSDDLAGAQGRPHDHGAGGPRDHGDPAGHPHDLGAGHPHDHPRAT